jgi:hypothetical protein
MRYGIAIVELGKVRKIGHLPCTQQRYFDEYQEREDGLTVDVRLLVGEWKTVNRKAVIRWPIMEKEE